MRRIGESIRAPSGQIVPLSPAIESNGMVYLSGQVSLQAGQIAGVGIEEQTHIIIDRISAILEEVELSLANVVRATVWLTDRADFADFNAVYASRFSEPFPARSTVVSALAIEGALVEIEVTAECPR